MARTQFIMLGGFLGAGKTTAISKLAQSYQKKGLRVGIVTNDQASDLVDTHLLRSQGFEVSEVAGSCFCCNFNELTRAADTLSAAEWPDVVIAEPVGSCTDLVATVIQPLLRLHADRFDVAPYGVLLKPSHGLRILRGDAQAGFSPQAAYIFTKQLEEADFIVINRIDELSADRIQELAQLLEVKCPGTPVLRMSARTGQGFDGLLEMLDQRGQFGRRILELDYDVYAAGEAELGWLNSSFTVTGSEPCALDDVLLAILRRVHASVATTAAEIAHLKIIGLADGAQGVANVVANDMPVQLSLPSRCQTREANIIVNARIAIDPEQLTSIVASAVSETANELKLAVTPMQTQSFRPGRPVPTHRYASAEM